MATAILNKSAGVGAAAAGLLKEVKAPLKKDEAHKLDSGPKFSDTLAVQADKVAQKAEAKETKISGEKPILKFSNHALERMNTRGIHFTPEQITKIEQGMQKAIGKGAKESLFLTDDSALIVSLKDNTVVTVMDKSMLRENVFTNIDATVFV